MPGACVAEERLFSVGGGVWGNADLCFGGLPLGLPVFPAGVTDADLAIECLVPPMFLIISDATILAISALF